MSGFDDIQDLLAQILDDSRPLPTEGPTAAAHKAAKGKKPMPREAVEAITQVAVESFDPELLEIASQEQTLSSAQAKKAAEKVRKHATDKFTDVVQSVPDTTPLPTGVFDEIHAAIDVADTIENMGRTIKADLPTELVPDPDQAFQFPEQAADAVAPTLKRAKKVTQGVTDELEVEGALANVKGAIFADTLDRQREEELESLRIPMPTFTSKDLMETMDIRNFATLVKLNTARWHAKVKDRQASRDAAMVNEADAAAFETRKRLLAGADDLLKAIHKSIDAARIQHYEMTLPWTTTGVDDNGRRTGARLLPNTLFFEYIKTMAEHRAAMVAALDKFVPEYPKLIQTAKEKLGKRFNPAEYPNEESIKKHFDLTFDFEPVPEGKDFQGLPQQQLDALARTINNKSQQMMENAMQDVWTRLYKAVTHMYERLASPDKTFHYTMTDNVREVTRLLKHLNVTGNADIEATRKYLDKWITPHDAKELRENNVLRQQTAAHLKNVLDKMRRLGGAGP